MCTQHTSARHTQHIHAKHTVVVDWLRQKPDVGDIGLWGRSMGAVTALMYSSRDPTVKGEPVAIFSSPLAALLATRY